MSKNISLLNQIDMNNLPSHVAIIMDGNGRWAKNRFLSRVQGHLSGVKTIKELIKLCDKIGIDTLTLFCFSTENWKRPVSEVSYLMNLFIEYLKAESKDMMKNNMVLKRLGKIDMLSKEVIDAFNEVIELTKNNTGLVVNIAINYGGRQEIIDAVRKVIYDIENNLVDVNTIDEEVFSNYLYTNGQRDPDLIIRTSGEKRLSNFLLWQSAYSEFYYADVNWPDFDDKEFYKAIIDYQSRSRRYGGI